MELVTLFLSILVLGQCRDLNHANGGKGPISEETERIRVCFEEPLGCFPETEPNKETSFFGGIADSISNVVREKFYLSSREKVNTEFRFWAPNKRRAVTITNFNFHVHIKDKSDVDTNLKTYFLVHGYFGGDEEWALEIKDALMKVEPCNVFIVDWAGGSGILYGTARANIWLVGAETGRFIQRLENITGLQLEKVHIIGHSLGAHAAGFVGKWVKDKMKSLVGRITGLDPAGPDFYDKVPGERLDRGDAAFVDVIHTNWGTNSFNGLGLYTPIGHFDFYANDGEDQPGCKTDTEALLEVGSEALELISFPYKIAMLIKGDKGDITDAVMVEYACSHHRSVVYFIESIKSNDCNFLADECDWLENYKAGKCAPGREGKLRVPMGFKADEFKDFIDPKASKKFYLRTNPKSPFCIE